MVGCTNSEKESLKVARGGIGCPPPAKIGLKVVKKQMADLHDDGLCKSYCEDCISNMEIGFNSFAILM